MRVVSTHGYSSSSGRNPPSSVAFASKPRASPRYYASMATPPPSSSAQATKKPLVSVFDWDDTLCPTTWLHHRGLLVAHGLIDGAPPMDIETFEQKPAPSPLTPSDRQRLELLEHQALELLQLAARFDPCSSSRRRRCPGSWPAPSTSCQSCASSCWTTSTIAALGTASGCRWCRPEIGTTITLVPG